MTAVPTIKAFFDERTNTDQLSRRRSGDEACGDRRSGARLRPRERARPRPSRPTPSSPRQRRLRLHGRLGARDPRPRRPFVGRALSSSSRPAPRSGSASISARCRRSSGPCSTRPTSKATAANSTICSRTASASSLETSTVEVHARAGPYARRRRLPDRRCRVRGRHLVHAGLRHGARRFPRRRCARALSLDQATAVAAARDAALHVPRLQGPGPRPLMPGRQRSPRSARTTSMSKTASARRSSSPCAKRATRRSPRPSCSCHRSRSICAPASSRLPMRMACAISRSQ